MINYKSNKKESVMNVKAEEIYNKIKTLRIPVAVSVRFFVDENYRLISSAAFHGADDQNEPEKI